MQPISIVALDPGLGRKELVRLLEFGKDWYIRCFMGTEKCHACGQEIKTTGVSYICPAAEKCPKVDRECSHKIIHAFDDDKFSGCFTTCSDAEEILGVETVNCVHPNHPPKATEVSAGKGKRRIRA